MRYWTTKNGYKVIQVISGRSNVFLLSNGESSILVDTGPEFMWETLQKRLEQLHIDNISLLVLTHSHFDHAGNAYKIKEKYKAKVMIHQSEAGYLAKGNNILPSGTNMITRLIVRLFARRFISMAVYHPCNYDLLAETTYDLSEFGFKACLIHTPGHTKGSVSLIIDNEIALVGDTMFGVFPWTIFPPFASDTVQLINNWGNLLKTGCRLFLPSHGSLNKRALVVKEFNKRKNKL